MGDGPPDGSNTVRPGRGPPDSSHAVRPTRCPQRLFRSGEHVPENNRLPHTQKDLSARPGVSVNSSSKSTQGQTDLIYPQGERLRTRSPTVGV